MRKERVMAIITTMYFFFYCILISIFGVILIYTGYSFNQITDLVSDSILKADGVMIVICPLSSRQVRYLKVSDKNTYISFWSVGIFMHTISLYIF